MKLCLTSLVALAGLATAPTGACDRDATPAPPAVKLVELAPAAPDAPTPAAAPIARPVSDAEPDASVNTLRAREGIEIVEGDARIIVDEGKTRVLVRNDEGKWELRTSDQAPQARRVQLGVVLGEINDALAAHLDVDPESSILIQRVVDGSAADRAGMKAHDILIEFAGVEDLTLETLRKKLGELKPGDETTAVVLRGGEHKKLSIEFKPPRHEYKAQGRLESRAKGWPEAPEAPEPPKAQHRFFGDLDAESRERLNRAIGLAEKQAEQAQRQAEQMARELEKQFGKLQEQTVTLSMKIDEQTREQIEQALKQVEQTLAEQDFDFDFDFDMKLEDFPRLRFIEIEEDAKNKDALRKGLGEARAPRLGGHQAVILEKRMEERQEKLEHHAERLAEQFEHRAQRLEELHERLEGDLERRLEQMERRLEQHLERMERMLQKHVERLERERH